MKTRIKWKKEIKFLFNDVRADEKQKNKLWTYRIFKTEYKQERYTSTLKNKSYRSVLAKFRLSNHSLLIEKGRHAGLQVEKRTCPFGCNKIEDEVHFFTECSVNEFHRKHLIQKVLPFNTSLLLSKTNFVNLMQTDNESTILAVASFLDLSFKCREAALRKPKSNPVPNETT